MPFDDVLKNPLLRKALEAGEEQVGRVMGKLLASEGVATGLQSLLSGAVHARQTLEKGVSQALHAVNLPSRDDVAAIRKKLEELEAMIDGLSERVDRDRENGGGGGG
jgi:hypothetical protein